MDSVHKLLNIVLPLISLFLLFFFLPAILLFKIFNSISRSVFCENVSSKIVLITGASSGIGEHLAYEYAKGGACLVLVARREKQLQEVACKARRLGSPDVIVETGDVSKVEDCKRFVDAALNHFGKLNHVVNNAGIAPLCLFEDADNVEDFAPIMNTNFWGSVYCTRFAIPHLRKSRGKIIVIASIAQWSPIPRLSIYSGSKGAVVSFYETLRVEVGSDIGITIVGPGVVDSEITRGDFMSKAGMDGFPVESTEGCTKAIFKSICRGDRYLFEPAWERTIYFWNLLCPEVIESFSRWRLLGRPNNSKSNSNSGALKSD
ncbi:11-beta-hydroxysteroid dehydrogenase A-like isoform X1 [Rhododendron vialii]|uniref:11-beta-hydroxysteroid dehydrogenase A-like isoform X1 n=1 Tax=Rhododendron vialii TaxID=182163 RepID=UPI00265FB18B|nr:11-beta-hydroxysteroid dehydrogenase A-like isoform X1 [Rhododendron vialii]